MNMEEKLWSSYFVASRPILTLTTKTRFKNVQQSSISGKLIILSNPSDYSKTIDDFNSQIPREMHHVQHIAEWDFHEFGLVDGLANAFYIENFKDNSDDDFKMTLMEMLVNKFAEFQSNETTCSLFIAD